MKSRPSLPILLVTTLIAIGFANGRAWLWGDPPETDLWPNWRLPTLGGAQFWTDEWIHDEWRIQRNVLTDHFRLLDPHEMRRAWGSWESCHGAWQEIRQAESVPPLKKKVILVLHGLGRTRGSMSELTEALAEDPEYSVLSFSYASTREPIGKHAQSLARVVSRLEGVEQIDFVAHSLGNIVIRRFLADQQAGNSDGGIDDRIHRIVMIAPPNQGSQLARQLHRDPTFRAVFGPSGQQLGLRWKATVKKLAIPPCPFGIIAGDGNASQSSNPILEGDDDFVVSLAETRLAGADDFLVVPRAHTWIMEDPQVHRYTLTFLRHGYFISPEQRSPIARSAADQESPHE